MKVTIKEKEYEFSFDSIWGPLYTYEAVAGNKLPYDPHKMLCLHILFWCILMRGNSDFDMPLDKFIIELNNVDLVRSMTEYYRNRMEVLGTGVSEEAIEEDDKKKD